MNGREVWDFLDDFKKNLVYNYVLTYGSQNRGTTIPMVEEQEMGYKSRAYIMFFVYRYVLKCETFEQAEKLVTIDNLKKYKLYLYFKSDRSIEEDSKRLFSIGNDIFGTVLLGSRTEEGIVLNAKIFLEILYNRYNYLEQINLAIKRYSNCKMATHKVYKQKTNQLIGILNRSLEFMDKHESYYGGVIERYNKTITEDN
jgi:hypothetical protein